MKTLQYDSKKIQFKDNINIQEGALILTTSLLILGFVFMTSESMSVLEIILFSSSIVASFFLARAYYLKDFSKSIQLDNISNIKLTFKLNGNIILKVYNKKGKCRLFNSINDREEAQSFIAFAKEKSLKIRVSDYQKQKIV